MIVLAAEKLRVLVVSSGIGDKFERFYYSFDKRFINGLIRLGHSVVHVPDRDVAKLALGNRSLGRYLAGRKLKAVAEAYDPHVIMTFHADWISNDVLRDVSRSLPAARILDIDCDLLTPENRFKRVFERGKVAHGSLVTSGGVSLARLRDAGLRAAYVPNPTDASFDALDTPSDVGKTWDLVYVASAAAHSPRWSMARSLKDAAPDLAVGMFGMDKQRVSGRDYYRLLANAKAALNWSETNDLPYYSSDRIGQLFGTGVCVCLPRSVGFGRFLNDEQAVFFDDVAELSSRLRTVISSGAWSAIGQAGQARYHALFNEERVAQYALDFILEKNLDRYEWADI